MSAPGPAIVAIPAQDEAERLGACLAALAIQRDRFGAPLPVGSFRVLVLANNCRDATARVAADWAALGPHPILCVETVLPSAEAHAGGARKRAMDLAADLLEDENATRSVILTTDADSCVAPTWVAENLAALALGADAVAGYIDAHAAEIVGLGRAFVERGRLEDAYLSRVAEIVALCDPRAHDPWPNHRVSSGASLAVTLDAYRAIGGLPALRVGEDVALTRTLVRAGYRVCHPMSVVVSTSCRLSGRAPGGAADTMRLRQADPDAPCDADMEPAVAVLRRAAWRGRLRRAKAEGALLSSRWAALGFSADTVALLSYRLADESAEAVWDTVEASSPVLRRGAPLRPSDLPGEIQRADRILRRLGRLRGASAATRPIRYGSGVAPLGGGRVDGDGAPA